MRRACLVLALVVVAAACPGQEWPRWRGPADTGRLPAGSALPTTLAAELPVVWKAEIGYGNGSPVVSKGRVYYIDNQQGKETAQCRDARTGAPVWSSPIDDAYQDFQSPAGPRATPTIDGDRLYVSSCKGEFRCLATADGKVLWRTNFVADYDAMAVAEAGDNPGASRHGNTGSAWVDGNRIIVPVGGRKGGSVVCFDRKDGRVIWKSESDIAGHSGPMVATVAGVKQVLAYTADAVIGLDYSTGTLLWRVPIKTRYGRNVTTPIVFEDSVVVGSTSGLFGIRVAKSGAAITGQSAWTSAGMPVNYADMVAIGPKLYALGPANRLMCVDIKTGAQAWVADRFFSGVVNTEWLALISDGVRLLAFTDLGTLMLVQLKPDGAALIAKTTVCGKNWCSPAYAGGLLYVRDDKEMRCIRTGGK